MVKNPVSRKKFGHCLNWFLVIPWHITEPQSELPKRLWQFLAYFVQGLNYRVLLPIQQFCCPSGDKFPVSFTISEMKRFVSKRNKQRSAKKKITSCPPDLRLKWFLIDMGVANLEFNLTKLLLFDNCQFIIYRPGPAATPSCASSWL